MAKKGKNRKQPKREFYPPKKKIPRTRSLDYRSMPVNWSFAIFDHETDWREDGKTEDPFREVGKHMQAIEGRTWGEIEANRKRDHSVEISRITPKARRRLQVLKRDDIDQLWRFRLSGERRIWGIKHGNILQILWWDPHHRICPSVKKHT